MNKSTRRHFLQTTAGLLAVAFTTSSFGLKKKAPLLSFSTLGCPDWTFEKIINFAAENNYKGIELRGIQRQLDLTKCNEFSSPENISATLKKMKEKGLRFVDLGSSAAMHHRDTIERQKNLDDAKRFIDLAQQLDCPYIRVFPNNLPKDQDRNATIDLIIKGLVQLGDYAKGSSVTVLMESHGELVYSADLEKIMQSAANPHVGLVWDIVNMWSVTKEPPATVYKKLKKYIQHTHIKDLRVTDEKEHYTLLGKGETPIFEAIDILYNDNYKGYYSFEWEKLWHPEIEEPETALADYPKAMMQHFNR
ncbi:MAG TPA: sugar phosphate isomerase/epimerase family protein [Panacibacter sp.]|nr:sugar phosphate isomerase/epimerase family protein [Panacibacter sp.]